MRLKKEIILVIIVIVSVLVLELVTNFFSNKSYDRIERMLNEVTHNLEVAKKQKENDELREGFENSINNNIEELKEEWLKEQHKLAFFFEHDELEKVTRSLIVLQENSKNQEYEVALENSQEFLYWLNHVKEKDSFKLKNIF